MIITDGKGQRKSGEENYNVRFGDKFLIPAATDTVEVDTESGLELILALPAE